LSKHGRGLGELEVDTNGLRQSSVDYNISRLERYIQAANNGSVQNPNVQLAQQTLAEVRAGNVPGFAIFHRSDGLYQLHYTDNRELRYRGGPRSERNTDPTPSIHDGQQ
jgi:hypothetical protein